MTQEPANRPSLAAEETDDAFLGGAVRLVQPRKGYRAGLDAVLLAAAAPVVAGQVARVLDAGAGAGAVGLCVAARCPQALVTMIEREAAMAALARRNVVLNGFGTRVRVVEADIGDRRGLARLQDALPNGAFDHVVANPPYHDETAGTLPTGPQKAAAHAMAAEDLEAWVRFMARMACADGTATMIHLARALPAVLAAFAGRFGAIVVRPVHARAGQPARRILVSGIKGSRAPLTLAAGFVLHGPDGHAFTPEADAILRHGAGLALS